MTHKNIYINGTWVAGEGKPFAAVNPATGATIWQGAAASANQVVAAVHAARQAQYGWMQLSLVKRAAYLEKFNTIVTEQRDELTLALAQDTGKPLWEAKAEIGAMLNKLKVSEQAFAERCREQHKNINGVTAVTRHKPHGVVVVLGPFNFPAHLPNGHIMPALLAGNTLVFKPSELTPLISEKIQNCWHQAGLPAGVINMLQGKGDVGASLVNHADVDGIFFTGSANTGLRIQETLIAMPQRIIALEMGGNNPLVYAMSDAGKDANIDAAVYHTIQSAFITSGQRCTCARRLIVIQNNSDEKFVEQLIAATKTIKVGAYTEQPEPFMGPLIAAAAADKVYQAYQQLVASNAEILVPMQQVAAFLTPGILDVTNLPNRKDEEIFGPLLQLIWVKDFAAAIAEANATSYGLAAGIFTDDEQLYNEFYAQVRAGIVNWNRPLTGASSDAPFGGVGQSGNHRPSAYYAADYCAYPVASLEAQELALPEALSPGILLT